MILFITMYHIHPGDSFDIEHHLKFHIFAKSLLIHYIKNDHLFDRIHIHYVFLFHNMLQKDAYKIFLKNDTFII